MFKQIAFWLRRKSYKKAFENWFSSGNRLLWIEGTIFIPIAITEVLPDYESKMWVWGCDAKETYFKSGFLDVRIFGEMITKETITEQIRENILPVSEEAFFDCLHIYNEMTKDDMYAIRYKFSFNDIDFNQFPNWLNIKLMEHNEKNENQTL